MMRDPSQIEEAKPQSQDWFEIVTLKLSDQQPIRYDFGDSISTSLLGSECVNFPWKEQQSFSSKVWEQQTLRHILTVFLLWWLHASNNQLEDDSTAWRSVAWWSSKMIYIARNNARYAPMDQSHIPSFPNPLPKVNWLTYLPIFKDENKYNVALHLVRFHMHVYKFWV